MRLLVGWIFISSGWSHAKDPVARAKSIGMSPGLTRVLGIAEVAGGVGVAIGVLPRVAAFGLILVILGAIQKKLFVWHTGFRGRQRRLALRSPPGCDEPGDRHDRRRALRPALSRAPRAYGYRSLTASIAYV
ncbi:MAG: DoxX family protein [Gemmatimonadales bacterium]